MANRIRKGDIVAIVAGDDKGKRGRVLRLGPERNRVVVEGVNLVFKHLRKSQQHPQGGRIRREAPVHMSNVMPVDSETNRPTRVKSAQQDGERVRVGVRSGAEVGTTGKKADSTKKAASSGKKED